MLTPEELKQRKNGIGGSDIAKLLGRSRRGGPLDLYTEKLTPFDESAEIAENLPAEVGSYLEPFLVSKYTQRTGKTVVPKAMTYYPDHPFMFANIDGFIENDGAILECKTTNEFSHREWGEPGTFQIPEAYKLQVAYYAMILGANYCDIAKLYSNHTFEIYRYDRRPALESYILEEVKNFWQNHIEKQIPPESKTSSESLRYLKSLVTEPNSKKVVTVDLYDAYKKLTSIKSDMAELKKQAEEKQDEICTFLQDQEELVDDKGRTLVTYRPVTSSRFDNFAFAAQYPDLYKEFSKPSTTRKFLVKGMSNG